jgi:hypothetical protein
MKTSENVDKLASALLKAQQAIKFAAKDSKNPHFKNSYADLESVIDAIKGPLNDAGIVFLQSPSPSDDGKLHLTTRLMHESGQWMEDTAVAPLPKQDPQGFGSTLTYLRRYSLSAITGLYQADDDGNAGSCIQQKPTAQARQAQPEPEIPQSPADVAMAEQMKAARDTSELVKIMNGLTNDQRSAVREVFNNRMQELKKAA